MILPFIHLQITAGVLGKGFKHLLVPTYLVVELEIHGMGDNALVYHLQNGFLFVFCIFLFFENLKRNENRVMRSRVMLNANEVVIKLDARYLCRVACMQSYLQYACGPVPQCRRAACQASHSLLANIPNWRPDTLAIHVIDRLNMKRVLSDKGQEIKTK